MPFTPQSAWPEPSPCRAVGSLAPSSKPKAEASSTAKRRFSTSEVSPPPERRLPSAAASRTQASPPMRTPQSGVKASFSV